MLEAVLAYRRLERNLPTSTAEFTAEEPAPSQFIETTFYMAIQPRTTMIPV